MSHDGRGDIEATASAPTEGLPTDFLSLGQVLGERYRVRSRLGRGGMGATHCVDVW